MGLITKVVFQEKNRGKGFAIKTAISLLEGDVAIIQDADLEYDPEDFSKIVEPILAGRADVVYGSRFLTGTSHRILYFWHSLGNKFLTAVSNMLTNLNFSDMETGYKVFRVDLLKRIEIKEERFGFEPEITAKIAKMKCRITWRDGIRALYCIAKYNIFK